jgi:hypothetical protein
MMNNGSQTFFSNPLFAYSVRQLMQGFGGEKVSHFSGKTLLDFVVQKKGSSID